MFKISSAFYIILWSFFLMSCKKEVAYIRPELKTITQSVFASGIIKSDQQYQVYAPVQGTIKKIVARQGYPIKKGDPIVIIANENASLLRENASLSATYYDINANKQKLSQLQMEIDVAVKKLQSDSLMMIRQKNLWQQNIGTKVDYEQKELAYFNSKIAKDNLKLKYIDLQKLLQFLSKQAQKNLSISNSQLADFTVKSSIDGLVYLLQKEEGEMVTPQTSLAVIGCSDKFIVELNVDEYDITKIKSGQVVLMRLDSYQDTIFRGFIKNITPFMNEKTRSFTVYVEFSSPPVTMYPNLSVEANIIIERKKNVVTIPASYLGPDSKVILIDGSSVYIKTGITDYKIIEIVAGLDTSTRLQTLR